MILHAFRTSKSHTTKYEYYRRSSIVEGKPCQSNYKWGGKRKRSEKKRMYSTLLSRDLYDVDCRETVTHKNNRKCTNNTTVRYSNLHGKRQNANVERDYAKQVREQQ